MGIYVCIQENVGYVKIILKKIVLEIEMVNNISADALQVRLFWESEKGNLGEPRWNSLRDFKRRKAIYLRRS